MCINPLKLNSNYDTFSYRPNLLFLIYDIRALWCTECQSARMSKIKNSRLGLYGAEYLEV